MCGLPCITIAALAVYIVFTITVTEWRTQFRKKMNELDSSANSRAIDSLLNYETVKYFNNEAFEARRYDENLERYRRAAVKSQTTLSMLNTGQQLIIAVALVAMLWRATQGVVEGRMTLGDLVMVNAFMIQLYIPLNFLGVIYREIKQSLTDLEKMFTLLEREREIADRAWCPRPAAAPGEASVRFENVTFSYDPAGSAGAAKDSLRAPSCMASASRFLQARRWPWSGPRALASPPWRACCSASTTCSRAAS